MNAVTPAPLRGTSDRAPSPAVRAAADYLPADPALILTQPLPSPRARNTFIRTIVVVAGLIFGAEMILPFAMKPSVVIGDAVARYHFRTMTVINDKEIELEEQKKIAMRRAEIEAERAKWAGICMFGALLDPQLAYKCQQFSNSAFDAAERSIRHSKEK